MGEEHSLRSGLRSSERWFNVGLWLVAIVFAFFLTGLGSLLVGDLPQVEQSYTLDAFLDRGWADPSTEALRQLRREQEDNQRGAEQAGLELDAARSASAATRETFANWLRTRDATQRVDQDPGLERVVETRLEELARAGLAISERRTAQERVDGEIRADAEAKLTAALRGQEARVFAYRLALTLPLLVLAGWLLARKRGTRNWPFVWGFAFFAAFAFFVELVPYMPSWGGYVLNAVGVIATLIGGRAAINAFQAYLERQKEAESRPDQERRVEIVTDQALVRLAKNACPACERPLNLVDPSANFCPHCGIGIFDRCANCDHRKSTFDRFCNACGEPAVATEVAVA